MEKAEKKRYKKQMYVCGADAHLFFYWLYKRFQRAVLPAPHFSFTDLPESEVHVLSQ